MTSSCPHARSLAQGTGAWRQSSSLRAGVKDQEAETVLLLATPRRAAPSVRVPAPHGPRSHQTSLNPGTTAIPLSVKQSTRACLSGPLADAQGATCVSRRPHPLVMDVNTPPPPAPQLLQRRQDTILGAHSALSCQSEQRSWRCNL